MKVGDSSFFGMGIPMFAGQGAYTRDELAGTANASFGWWHHSVENTIDKVEWNFLDAHMRTYVAYLWALCTSPLLPMEFVSVADEISARLAELASVPSGIELATATALAAELRKAAGKLDGIAGKLAAEVAAGADAEAQVVIVNRCLKKLSRLLVPLASTRIGTYGHDPYGNTAQTTTLPLLFELPLLSDESLPVEQRTLLETELLRGRNRITDMLAAAVDLVEATMSAIQQNRQRVSQ